jgi:centromeric protein E
LLAARLQIDSQANQILSLEASLLARPSMSTEGATDEKDRLLTEQAKTIKELEAVVKAYEDRSGSDSSAVISEEERRTIRDEIEKEWIAKVEDEKRVRVEKERWAEEVTKALDKEKKVGEIHRSFLATTQLTLVH